jgi:hypothetical protein
VSWAALSASFGLQQFQNPKIFHFVEFAEETAGLERGGDAIPGGSFRQIPTSMTPSDVIPGGAA